MDANAHTTPETRYALRKYLRDRRMVSIHQTITVQTLNDLEESLQLLIKGRDPSEAWKEDVEGFLAKLTPFPPVPTFLRQEKLWSSHTGAGRKWDEQGSEYGKWGGGVESPQTPDLFGQFQVEGSC